MVEFHRIMYVLVYFIDSTFFKISGMLSTILYGSLKQKTASLGRRVSVP